MGEITVLGSLNMDLVVPVPELPAPGETVLGGHLRTHAGGKGANQAVAAARLGGRARMVGRVGDDDHGRALRANLDRHGVDVSHVAEDRHHPTGAAVILVAEGGENVIAVAPGANAAVDGEDATAAAGATGVDDVLLLQLEIPMEASEAAAVTASRSGVRVILNAAPAAATPPSLLGALDVLVVNEHEAGRLLGYEVHTTDQALHAAAGLRRLGPRAAVVTLGTAGAAVADEDSCVQVPAFPVRAVDATGAGDAFVGAMAVCLADGMRLAEAVRMGCAAGALAVTRHGAQDSLPTTDEVRQLLASRETP